MSQYEGDRLIHLAWKLEADKELTSDKLKDYVLELIEIVKAINYEIPEDA